MATTAATGIDVSEFAEFAVSLDDVELKQVCSGVCVTLPQRRLLVPPTCQHHRYCRNAIVPRPVAVCHFYLRLFWHPAVIVILLALLQLLQQFRGPLLMTMFATGRFQADVHQPEAQGGQE